MKSVKTVLKLNRENRVLGFLNLISILLGFKNQKQKFSTSSQHP